MVLTEWTNVAPSAFVLGSLERRGRGDPTFGAANKEPSKIRVESGRPTGPNTPSVPGPR
jgi:hypothetical protein